jgi:hypothetical protein
MARIGMIPSGLGETRQESMMVDRQRRKWVGEAMVIGFGANFFSAR